MSCPREQSTAAFNAVLAAYRAAPAMIRPHLTPVVETLANFNNELSYLTALIVELKKGEKHGQG